jgi:DNA-binding transcriptional regulator GbsR (MarR family)
VKVVKFIYGPGVAEQTPEDPALLELVEEMALLLESWGFPRMPGRVLILLMATEQDSLDAGELAEGLGVSPAAISGAVRYLVDVGLVVPRPHPGRRRATYAIPDAAWYEASVLKSDFMNRVADRARSGADTLGGPETAAGARFTEMAAFFDFIAEDITDMLARWRARAGEGE